MFKHTTSVIKRSHCYALLFVINAFDWPRKDTLCIYVKTKFCKYICIYESLYVHEQLIKLKRFLSFSSLVVQTHACTCTRAFVFVLYGFLGEYDNEHTVVNDDGDDNDMIIDINKYKKNKCNNGFN